MISEGRHTTDGKHLFAALLLAIAIYSPSSADEPTLARLSFWVPPERMVEFEAAYNEQVAPFLKERGFVASSQPGRATVDSVFSRLFEFESPAEFATQSRALGAVPEWHVLLRSLGTTFGTLGDNGAVSVRPRFRVYATLAGLGKTVFSGSGLHERWWRSFGPENGLVDDARAQLQDRSGNLWFTGPFGGGVTRFDGARFTQLTADDGLVDGRVQTALEDTKGVLWFGTLAGVSRFDGTYFTAFTVEDGVPRGGVRTIEEDIHGNLWFGTGSGGATLFDGTSFTTFTRKDGLADNAVNTIYRDRQGDLWFGTGSIRPGDHGGGVSRYNGEKFTTYTAEDGLASNKVVSIAEDKSGNLWLGTGGGLGSVEGAGVSRFDGTSFTTFTTLDGLASNQVNAILEDRQGVLWFGTESGITRYDGQQFSSGDEMFRMAVGSIVEDRLGNLWFGRVRYGGYHFSHFSTLDGLANNDVYRILQDREGNLWFSFIPSGMGVSRYDGEQFTTFTTKDGLPHNAVRSMLQDRRGDIWFGTRGGGVTRFDGQTFVTFTETDGLANNDVRSILEDSNGALWFGCGEGVSRFDGQTFAVVEDLSGHTVWTMFEDKQGYLWFGTVKPDTGVGAIRYDGENFAIFNTQNGLGGDDVRSIVEDEEGQLWLGGSFGTGLNRFDGREFASVKGGSIWRLSVGSEGHLWFMGGGSFGATRYDGLVFQTLSRKDGILNDTVWDALQDRQGNFWFATKGGLTRYRSQDAFPPSAFLTHVIADRTYGPIRDLSLPSTQAFVTFQFQGASMTTDPEDIVYVYRLRGFDEEWRMTPRTEVEFTDLPRGEYLFEVKAVDRDLNYSAPVTVQLTIHPPYGRIAFAGGLGLALVGLVAASVYGVKRRRERDQTRHSLGYEQRQRLAAQQQIAASTSAEELHWRSEDFVEQSPVMQQLFLQIESLWQPPHTQVLIVGETGNGKELLARAIHFGSTRHQSAFVPVHCASIPQDMQSLEIRTRVLSQLFGHAAGAFEGADSDHDGKVVQADGGTLFLDEVGLLPLPLQAQLERVLRLGEVRRLGEETSLSVDVRTVASTQMDLESQVEMGLFRQELYDFISRDRLEVPPLRERPDDMALLAQRFVDELRADKSEPAVALASGVLTRLQAYSFPGNVRELKQLIERAVQESGGRALELHHLHLPDTP